LSLKAPILSAELLGSLHHHALLQLVLLLRGIELKWVNEVQRGAECAVVQPVAPIEPTITCERALEISASRVLGVAGVALLNRNSEAAKPERDGTGDDFSRHHLLIGKQKEDNFYLFPPDGTQPATN
jgi:hypothetical protein